MFDILQPTSLILYKDKPKKEKIINKPAVIIAMNENAKTGLPEGKRKDEAPLPFEEWKIPVQEDGYLKGSVHDLL